MISFSPGIIHSIPSMTPIRKYLPSIFILMLLGWGGLAGVLFLTLPTVWPRWAFFFLWVVALTGTALPLAYLFNHRFPTDPPADSVVLVRQALWIGVFGATLAWLQLGRLVTLWVIVGLAGGLTAIEYFIRLRELARRRPANVEARSSETNVEDAAS